MTQELHDSLPSDPAEADLLKMAEAVADASDDADCVPAAKRGLYSRTETPRCFCIHPLPVSVQVNLQTLLCAFFFLHLYIPVTCNM